MRLNNDFVKIYDKHLKWLKNKRGGERANFRKADLSFCNLARLDLRFADFREAELDGTNFTGTDLRGADLRGAKIYDAIFEGTRLSQAILDEAQGYDINLYLTPICPEEGSFIGFKHAQGHIVKLRILDDAKRCSGTWRVCRCDKAEVLSITNVDGSESGLTKVHSDRDYSFVYEVGKIVTVDNFGTDRWDINNSPGIYFYLTRGHAVRFCRSRGEMRELIQVCKKMEST